MDDTLWIAQSKTELEQIINIATSFYQMADIQVNPINPYLLPIITPITISLFLTVIYQEFLKTNYSNFWDVGLL